jgi:hypothetical protein
MPTGFHGVSDKGGFHSPSRSRRGRVFPWPQKSKLISESIATSKAFGKRIFTKSSLLTLVDLLLGLALGP